jgi:hypothetical protein
MKKALARRLVLAVTSALLPVGCGAAPASPSPQVRPVEVHGRESGTPEAVLAGRYRLSLSMNCQSKIATATGVLTLQPMSGAEGGNGAAVLPGEGLLWGQTDLDLGHFLSCLGRSGSPAGEPIHPSVLVEVLRWDGQRHHQVLLVSTESPASASTSSGVGVAMWVEHADQGHIAGVWSRWELMGRGEGSWEADLLSER